MTGLWKGVSDIFEMTGKRKIMAPAVEAIKFSYSAAALAELKAAAEAWMDRTNVCCNWEIVLECRNSTLSYCSFQTFSIYLDLSKMMVYGSLIEKNRLSLRPPATLLKHNYLF